MCRVDRATGLQSAGSAQSHTMSRAKSAICPCAMVTVGTASACRPARSAAPASSACRIHGKMMLSYTPSSYSSAIAMGPHATRAARSAARRRTAASSDATSVSATRCALRRAGLDGASGACRSPGSGSSASAAAPAARLLRSDAKRGAVRLASSHASATSSKSSAPSTTWPPLLPLDLCWGTSVSRLRRSVSATASARNSFMRGG